MLLSDSPLQQSARDHLMLHFSRNGSPAPLLVLERGEGPYVFDTEGNRYLDGLSSLFCAQIGYSYGEELASVAQGRWLPAAALDGRRGPARGAPGRGREQPGEVGG